METVARSAECGTSGCNLKSTYAFQVYFTGVFTQSIAGSDNFLNLNLNINFLTALGEHWAPAINNTAAEFENMKSGVGYLLGTRTFLEFQHLEAFVGGTTNEDEREKCSSTTQNIYLIILVSRKVNLLN